MNLTLIASRTDPVMTHLRGLTPLWVQLVSFLEQEQTNDASGDWYSTDQTTNTLDTSYAYPFEYFYGYPHASDSPYTRDLTAYKAVSRTDSMQMWFMFKPDGGQWVPLKKVNWNWHGAGTLSGTNWTITSSYNSPTPTAMDNTTHPEWSDNVTNHFVLHKM